MAKRIRSNGVRSVLLIALLGAAFGIWQGVAGASTTSITANTIWHDRNECSTESHTYPVGTVRMSRIGKKIYVKVNIMGGDTNTDYDITLYSKPAKGPDTCNDDYFLGTITTDGNGNASGTFLSGPETKKYFFVDAFSDGWCDCNNETDWQLL